MKITAVILLATCLQAAAAGYGQKVTISEKDAPVEKIFSLIRKQTGFQFLYANQVLAQARKVTIQVKNAELEDVLAATFNGQPFEYHIKDKTIVVRMRAAPASLSAAADASQPPVDVRGRIVNASGEPVAGATVMVEGTKKSTVTNANGEFTLTGVNENAILQISHVQYEGEAIVLNGRSTVNATLQVKVSSLDEMQVIAYGTTTKRLNTGNVATIKASDIEKQPVNNPLLALQGRVPGLVVTQSTGLPGSGVSVRIQGQNTISSLVGNDPLVVIDGVPYPSRQLALLSSIQGSSGSNAPNPVYSPNGSSSLVGRGSALSFVNPADIESIEVLKDADATAIYGSQAANGAILITTKKGKPGKTMADVNIQQGWGKVARKLDLLNTEQYIAMRREAVQNDNIIVKPTDANYDINGTWDENKYTDWQKVLIGGTSHYTDARVSLSGGNANTQFLISPSYHRETTVYPGDMSDKRGSLHFNINNVSDNQKFKLQLSATFLSDNNNLIDKDLTDVAIKLAPNAPDLYNEDGSLNSWAPNAAGSTTWQNPLTFLNQEYTNKTKSLVSSAAISYLVFKGIEVKSNFGYTSLTSDQRILFPFSAAIPERRGTVFTRNSVFSNNRTNTWIIEPQISYKGNISQLRIDALLGTTIRENENQVSRQEGSDYDNDDRLKDINAAPTKRAFSGASVYKYNALFGRLNLSWADKYLITATARRDGSSRFGSKNQFHNFGAIGVGWIFTNESVIKDGIHFLSFGKIRASYGTTGNDQIGDYNYLNLYSTNIPGVNVPYQGTTGLEPNRLPNPYIAWEETKKLQLGIELGFVNDRFLITANYFRNRSSNQLLSYSLPIMTGFSSITNNFPALVQNTGWEFALVSKNIQSSSFRWSTNINLTIPKNKLVEFPGIATSSYANTLIVGEPITITRVLNFYNVDPTTGMYQFLDKDGNPTLAPNSVTDATMLINSTPKFYGGFQNTFQYKQFELDFLFQFTKQIGYNYFIGNLLPGGFSGSGNSGNQPQYVLDHWQKSEDEASIQKYGTFSNTPLRNNYTLASTSSLAYSDASYIRLKTVSLSWQLPVNWSKKIKMQGARLFMHGQNLITITDYKGLDPETLSATTLPPLRIVTAGANLSF